MPEPSKPTTLVRSGIKISHREGAQQLVILCHGGWKPISRPAGVILRQSGDGATAQMPAGTKLFCYVSEGVKEAGFSVLDAVMMRPASALLGLSPIAAISPAEFSRPGHVQSALDFGSNIGVVEVFSAADSSKQPHDYALFYHDEADEKSFAKHVAGGYPADVDLATICKGVTHKRHLSDVFAMTRDMGYKVYHYAACRVKRD